MGIYYEDLLIGWRLNINQEKYNQLLSDPKYLALKNVELKCYPVDKSQKEEFYLAVNIPGRIDANKIYYFRNNIAEREDDHKENPHLFTFIDYDLTDSIIFVQELNSYIRAYDPGLCMVCMWTTL